MNYILGFLGNMYPHMYSSAAGGYQHPAQTLVLVSMAHMMVVGFIFLYQIFRKDNISPKYLFLVFVFFLYMCAVTFAVSYLAFWSENPLAFPVIFMSMFITTIFTVALLLLSPALNAKGVIRDWRSCYRYTVPAAVILVLWELSMGFLYGSGFLPHDSSPFLLAVNNVDFAVMMIIEAVFFLLIARKKRQLPEFALFTFAISMALMPDFFIRLGDLPVLVSTLLSSLVMMVNIVILYILQLRSRTFNSQVLVLVLAACNLLSMTGLSVYAVSHNLILISSAMVLSMAAYFFLLTHRLPDRPVSSYRTCSFLLLVLINGAELTMSFGVTSLGFSITNSIFPQSATGYVSYFTGLHSVRTINFSNPLWWLFPFDPVKMVTMAFHNVSAVNAFFAYCWSSFMLVMATTMSPFYAIMMGSEMSYLVLERYRHAGNKSVRNWALAIIAGIPLFVILVPFYTPFYIFGMSGMLFSVSLLLLVISIIVIIVVSVLFGRRVQCNLVCMAAHMWTNVYYDQFKPQRDHPSVWGVLRWVSFSIMILSLVAFVLEETGSLAPVKVGEMPLDLIFYGMFVLNYIWWLFYFLTPVFGAYSCARQGWCGFGTLAGLFNRFFFKIKAADNAVCEACKTRECEAGCPAAIPLQADFLRKGSSSKLTCIGCGDCVEACPQDNLRIVDVRDYLRQRKVTVRSEST
jgi:ferredoxin